MNDITKSVSPLELVILSVFKLPDGSFCTRDSEEFCSIGRIIAEVGNYLSVNDFLSVSDECLRLQISELLEKNLLSNPSQNLWVITTEGVEIYNSSSESMLVAVKATEKYNTFSKDNGYPGERL